MMDRYQAFGTLSIIFSLFFGLVVAQDSSRILFLAGILYGLLFIFHKPLKRAVGSKTEKPLFAYGLAVVINGLVVEVLAYLSNLDKIKAGLPADLFATSSLAADLLVGLPYYIANAWVFVWALKRYQFTAFQLGFIIWLFNAFSVDVFKHFVELLQGNVLGFAIAGIIMLFTLHGPIVLFEDRIAQAYPNRSNSTVKYLKTFLLQFLPLAVTFAIVFIKFNILPNFR